LLNFEQYNCVLTRGASIQTVINLSYALYANVLTHQYLYLSSRPSSFIRSIFIQHNIFSFSHFNFSSATSLQNHLINSSQSSNSMNHALPNLTLPSLSALETIRMCLEVHHRLVDFFLAVQNEGTVLDDRLIEWKTGN